MRKSRFTEEQIVSILNQSAKSGEFRTVIPKTFGHPFRFSSDTYSENVRTLSGV